MKDDLVFIRHILEEINYLTKQTPDLSLERLSTDETIGRAVLRSLEIIGEASKNVSLELKNAHPEITWREMAGLRDKLIHFYFGVDWEIIWNVVNSKIPPLKSSLEKLLTK